MSINAPANRCRACGATSYKPVLARDGAGAMRPTKRCQCTGCDVVFEGLSEWRDGEARGITVAPGAPFVFAAHEAPHGARV